MDALPAALARIAGGSRIVLAGVEGSPGDLAALTGIPAGVPCFVEVPVTNPAAIRTVALGEVAAALRASDADEVVREAPTTTLARAGAARRLFTAYGSCSTSEPVADRRALGPDRQFGGVHMTTTGFRFP